MWMILGSLVLTIDSGYSFSWKMNLAAGLPNHDSMMLNTSRSGGRAR
jgi:hypothetical protein